MQKKSSTTQVAERITRFTTNPRHALTTYLLDDDAAILYLDNIVAVPSVLFDFFECAASRMNTQSDSSDIPNENTSPCRLVDRESFVSSSEVVWFKDSVPVSSFLILDDEKEDIIFKIRVQILLHEDERGGIEDDSKEEFMEDAMLHEAFRGRVVTQQSICFFRIDDQTMIVMIHAIVNIVSGELSFRPLDMAYRLDEKGQRYQIERIPSPWETDAIAPVIHTAPTTTAPGYERTVQQLQALLQSPVVARPTGILVTGCAGVGKTRLVRAALGDSSASVHWVSVTDLLQHAAWQSEQEVFQRLQPPQGTTIYVWDDLQDIYTSNDDDQESMEVRLVKHCLLQMMDSSMEHSVVIIGICREHQVPGEFTKTGRLEVALEISPPTQWQREQILMDWLHCFSRQVLGGDDTIQQWATRLAEVTPGCVAQDLYRLCSDARMRARADNEPLAWNHLRDVAEACIPSQLALLDVSKPRLSERIVDIGERHQESWRSLAGYESVKKRVFRTVVLPWKRFMESSNSSASYPPPRGVLFHGPSGCGKTVAAECLGESLGLPMIRVHAADILDKYVGGSEASLRSLFARARSASPCVLFMDEIDSIASNRAKDGEEVNVMSRLLSTLLNEMDGVSSQSGQMLIVACTNRLDALDAALLRPGRLEEHVLLGHPTSSDIHAILQTSLSRIPCDEQVDLSHLAEQLQGWTSARVAGVARDAILSWIRETQGNGCLMQSHFPAEVMSVW